MKKTIVLVQSLMCVLFAFASDSTVKSTFNDGDFKVFAEGQVASIYVDDAAPPVCLIAAQALSTDIERVCGTAAPVVHAADALSGSVIFIGTADGPLLRGLSSPPDVSDIAGQWESWTRAVVDKPMPGVDRGLVIVGSDRRGAAFGVFDLSEAMGVSPWVWWADVPVVRRDTIVVPGGCIQQGPPSVKYRGIFINDEDWGLQPWAAKTYSPADGDIGPAAYERVFELLLRLKANYLWPAMHPCTRAFNAFEENKHLADAYAIVMGSSHCEQMLRDNVDEWHRWQPSDGSERGPWDWCTNSGQLVDYWADRVRANGAYENIYTMGMRGIHDSGMPCSGASKREKVVKMQDEVVPAQRRLLGEYVDPVVADVPQLFCPYKEVLELYDMGMRLPEDITLVWPDDNHGYIRRLSNTAERARSGGGGVYYHVSYWGSPHDYLWLCTTPPALIWEQMHTAYAYGADRIWILNVGDIKPAEIAIDFFMQMGWDIDRWNAGNIDQYLTQWAARTFGSEQAADIAAIMRDYYQLARSRRPEHMGFGTIYPTTPNGEPAYSLIHNGDESQQRIDRYRYIEQRAKTIMDRLDKPYRDAFYQLVYYPVRGASLMNQKFLYAQKSRFWARQEAVAANVYADKAQAAYAAIDDATDVYNHRLAGGKWNRIMTDNPRGLPVFDAPDTDTVTPADGAVMGVIVEGHRRAIDDPATKPASPFSDDFSKGRAQAWKPMTPDRWTVRPYEDAMEYAVTTTDYENRSGDRLGALSVIADRYYDNFDFRCKVRSCDNLATNNSADFAFVFGYVDTDNYNYLIMSSNPANSGLYRVAGGARTMVQMANGGIPDNRFHTLAVRKTASNLTVRYNDRTLLTTTAPFDGGAIGVGSYNDAAAFADVQVTPLAGGSSPAALPAFNLVTDSRHFIDIFNKGDTAFDWTAGVSEPWVKLNKTAGTVDGEQRVWVRIDADKVPAGEHAATVTVAGAGQRVEVTVPVRKPADRPKADFAQVNGCVSIEAEHFSDRINEDGAAWTVVPDLGRSGDAVMILPVTAPSRTPDALAHSPALSYTVDLTETGKLPVTVYCLPTHAITTEHGLRYAVAFDDAEPQVVDFDTKEWSGPWSVNVLRGAAVTTTTHIVSTPGRHTLTIRMVDPGVVIDKIVIGTQAADYLGPPETRTVD